MLAGVVMRIKMLMSMMTIPSSEMYLHTESGSVMCTLNASSLVI